MNRALPWNVGKMDFDPRKAARDAAQRQGKSLGEWLHGVIADHAADLGVDEHDISGPQRIHAVTSKLERLSARGERNEATRQENSRGEGERRPRARMEGRRRSLRDEPGDERRYDARSDRDPMRDPLETTELLLEDAIAAMEQRAQRAEQHADHALQSVTRLIERTEAERERERDSMNVLAQKLTDIEARLKDRFADTDDVPIQGAIARLEARIDTIGRPSESLRRSLAERRAAPAAPAPQNGASRYQSRLQEKLESVLQGTTTPLPVPPPTIRPQAASASAAPKTYSRLQEKLNSIIEPPAAPLAPPPWTQEAPAPVAAQTRDRRLAAALAEISRRQRSLEEPARPAAGPQSSASQSSASQSSGPQSAAPQPSALMRRLQSPAPRPERQESAATVELAQFSAIQKEIATLATTIENLRQDVLAPRMVRRPTADVTTLRERISLLMDTLHGLEARGGFDGLDSYMDAILLGVSDARDAGRDEAIYRQVESVLESLRHAMPRLDTRTLVRGALRELRALSASAEAASHAGLETDLLKRLEEGVASLLERLTNMSARPLAAERMAEQVKTLAARLGRRNRQSKAPPDLGAYVEELHILIGQSTDVTALQKIKTEIAELSQLLAAGDAVVVAGSTALVAESTSVRALERMVRDLSEKFEAAQRPNSDPQALDALQAQVGALLSRFDRTENDFAKLAALERSMHDLFALIEEQRGTVEEAASEAAREAVRLVQSDTPAHGERELNAVLREEAADRTSATLAAVSQTLEKVVDRLSVLESGIAQTRAPQPPATPAPETPRVAEPAPARDTLARDTLAGDTLAKDTLAAAAKAGEDKRLETRPAAPATGESVERTGFEDKPLGAKSNASKQAASKQTASEQAEPDGEDKRADFIAAARRAAQAAQASVVERERAMRANPKEVSPLGSLGNLGVLGEERVGKAPGPKAKVTAQKGKATARAGLIQQSRSFVAQQKRPVLLSLAALCVVAGTLTVIRMSGSEDADTTVADNSVAPATTSVASNAAPAGTPVASAIETNPAQPGHNKALDAKATPAATVAGAIATPANKVASIDPIQTGSVPALPAFAAGAPAPQASIPVSLKTLADAGYAAAQYTIGVQYAEGSGIPRDFAKAAQWYQKAADQNLAPAQYRLASLYEKGLGVPQDKAKARTLYLKAAEAGNPRAMHNLAVLLADGDGKPDYEGASNWFRKAAEFGIRDSQYNLAILLARGIGVKQSFLQSYQWFAIAAAQGDTDAAKKRDEVGTKLRQSDLDVATALANAFHPRTPDKNAVEVTPPPGGWDSLQQGSTVNSPRPKISSL